MDVVCVKSVDGNYYSTEFYVRFPKEVADVATMSVLGLSEDSPYPVVHNSMDAIHPNQNSNYDNTNTNGRSRNSGNNSSHSDTKSKSRSYASMLKGSSMNFFEKKKKLDYNNDDSYDDHQNIYSDVTDGKNNSNSNRNCNSNNDGEDLDDKSGLSVPPNEFYRVLVSSNGVYCETIFAYMCNRRIVHFYDFLDVNSYGDGTGIDQQSGNNGCSSDCTYGKMDTNVDSNSHGNDSNSNKFSTTPGCQQLAAMRLRFGCNTITFCHTKTNATINVSVWVYLPTDKLVVMDIDGTITKSDIQGYIQTVFLGLFSYIHKGIFAIIVATTLLTIALGTMT